MHIYSLQFKRNAIKGCEIYVVHMNENQNKEVKNLLTDDPILHEFQDVFRNKFQDYLLEGT
jgi:hypothetical protein